MTNSEVIQDFSRRWQGTFVWLDIADREEELVKVDLVEETGGSKIATMHLSSDTLGKFQINFGSDGHQLRFKYPPVGVFQHETDAMVFYRRPQRQYRRGICPDNSVLFNVTRNVVGNRSRWNHAEIRDAFEHETYSVKEALKMLKVGGFRGVALRDNFTLTQTLFENPDYVLWHWVHPIARVDSKGKLTVLMEEDYRPTVQFLLEDIHG